MKIISIYNARLPSTMLLNLGHFFFENLLIHDEIMCRFTCYRLVLSRLVSSFLIVSMFLINDIYEHIEKYLFRDHVTVN